MKYGVPGIARAGVGYLVFECWRVPNHRRKAVFRECLSHLFGRLEHENRRGVLIDMKADDRFQNRGFSDLRATFDDNGMDSSLGYRVHDAFLIGRAVGAELSRFGAILGTQLKELIRPLADRQFRRRLDRLECRFRGPI